MHRHTIGAAVCRAGSPWPGSVRGWWCAGDRKLECGAVAGAAANPDRAEVSLGDRPGDWQAEPEPTGLSAAVATSAGEPGEDPVEVGFRDTAPGVGHSEDSLPVLDAGAELDAVTFIGVGDRVFQQRVQRGRQPVAVSWDADLGQLSELPAARRVAPAL